MIEIWADGACEPNPGIGGWGYAMVRGGNLLMEDFGFDRQTTNNRMEMMAVLQGMRVCGPESAPLVHSDSQYVIKGCTIWRKAWQRNGFKKGKMPNIDLWKQLHVESDRVSAQFKWVRGHSGIKFNEYADLLANRGRMQANAV